MNYEKWVKGTRSTYGDDPTEWDGNNTPCNLCYKDAEMDDEFCEDHQPCIMCGENDDCECEDEWSERSDCCEAQMDRDQGLCYECKDHCESAWDRAVEDANVKYAVKSVKDLPTNNQK